MAGPTIRDSTPTNPGGSGSSITAVLPTHAVGDIIIIPIGNTGNTSWTSDPAGWIRKTQVKVGTASNGIVGSLFYHVVLAGEGLPLANPTFNLAATVTRMAFAMSIEGALEQGVFTAPWWLGNSTVTGTANPVRPGAITTQTPDSLIAHFYFQRAATNAPDPSTYTQDEEIIISGTLVGNLSHKSVAVPGTSLTNQDASPTSGVRWAAGIMSVPIAMRELIGTPYGKFGERQMSQLLAT